MQWFGSFTDSPGYTQRQLTSMHDSGFDGIFDPTKYYEIQLSVNRAWQPYGSSVNTSSYEWVGGAHGDLAMPYFAIVKDNFQITPDSESTGLSLSGAQDFCNDAFASSTGIGATIANGLCVGLGFLFIPSSGSISQYADLSTGLSQVIPFSYGYDVASIFGGLEASTTQNFPTYSIGLSAIDFSSSTAMGPIFPSTLEFLSTTTINQFLPAGMHDLLYNLMIFIIWVEVAFVLYHKVVPKKAKI